MMGQSIYSEIIWCLSRSTPVHWAEWNNSDEAVLYIETTGQTLVISLFTVYILELLSSGSYNQHTLYELMKDSTDKDIQANELKTSIHTTLNQLQQLDVIEPCPN